MGNEKGNETSNKKHIYTIKRQRDALKSSFKECFLTFDFYVSNVMYRLLSLKFIITINLLSENKYNCSSIN